MTDSLVEIVEYTDPLCSIAWGTEPYKRLMQWRFEGLVKWRPVMAGLCRDNSTVKMFQPWDPVNAGQIYLKIWKRVTGITGMPYPEDLQYMALSTDPPCLVVKAAERQGVNIAEAVLRRLREAVFFYGTPVDKMEQIEAALEGVPGLDIEQLMADCDREDVKAAYLSDWEETRRPNDYVRGLADTDADHLAGPMMKSEGHERYNLPTFVFVGPNGEKTVPGYRPYAEYEAALEAVSPGIVAKARARPSQDEARAKWPTLTSKELEVICGTDSAEGIEFGGARIYLNDSELTYWNKRKAS
ncbi:MAG: DsbA family protein [Pseudomonadales bacterium]|nr:DsbA family protein [Pseudomonadales bacterium]